MLRTHSQTAAARRLQEHILLRSDFSLNFNDEGQERGYWLHDVEDDGTVHSTFQQLPTRQYKTIRLKDEDVAEIINADRAEDKFPFRCRT